MKNEYLAQLKELLDHYVMDENEKLDIISDYSDMYDNWIERGMTEDEVEEKLGKPKRIINSLVEGYKRIPKPKNKDSKIIALTPFISLIAFFILGFGFEYWQYAWMTFLLIPVTAIIFSMKEDEKEHMTTALSPFVATVAYFIIGFQYNLWHPGWLVFLIIPVIAIFNSRREMKFFELLVALSPFVSVTAFIYLGENGYYHPGWLVFFLIPFLALNLEKHIGKRLLLLSTMLLGIGGYLYLGYYYDEWIYTLSAFLPFVLAGLWTGNITIWDKETPREYKIVIMVALSSFVVLGLLTGLWEVVWLVFLAIPVYAIYREVDGNEKIIAVSPFIATVIFFLVGYFFDAWAWSWMAYLIIPMTAIIKE